MTVTEVERELEIVENAVAKNIDIKDVQSHIARGIWAVALQLARLVEGVEKGA